MSEESIPEEIDHGVRLGRMRVDVAAWVYATVTLMSVLVVYDGWEDRKRYLGVIVVVVAPTFALALAHLFADVLDFHVRRHRPPARHELTRLLEHATQYLMVCLPPLMILLVTGVIPGIDIRGSIQIMIWFAVLSLGFWGWFAGRRAGLTGARLLGATMTGLLIGLVVIGLQILLKPH